MKIIHTSDWHLGQKLYDRSRAEEQRGFLGWLAELLLDEKADLLLVCGDVFDSAVPSAEAEDMYYTFLDRVTRDGQRRVVVIAGNHDSIVRLEAPRAFLSRAGIHVAGSLEVDSGDLFVQIPGRDGTSVSLGLLPYISAAELLCRVPLEGDSERSERYALAIREYLRKCVVSMPAGAPKIIAGHLFVQGGEESGSERSIHQIGGASPLRVSDLPQETSYVALGHLHRPQVIGPAFYCGSPLPLSFREALHKKRVNALEFDREGRLVLSFVEVPIFRRLKSISGTEAEILRNLHSDEWTGSWVEVCLRLVEPSLGIGDRIRRAFEDAGAQVLAVKAELPQTEDDLRDFSEICARDPVDMFREFYRRRYHEDPQEEILRTFEELLHIMRACEEQEEHAV